MTTKPGGYIRLYRAFRESRYWPKGRKFTYAEAWIDLLMMARWKDGHRKVAVGGSTVRQGKGQVVCSFTELGKRWGWDRKTAARFIKGAIADDDLTNEKPKGLPNGWQVLSFVKWDTYNGPLHVDHPTPAPTVAPTDDPSATQGQPKHDPTLEEGKEDQELKKGGKPPRPSLEIADLILDLWPEKSDPESCVKQVEGWLKNPRYHAINFETEIHSCAGWWNDPGNRSKVANRKTPYGTLRKWFDSSAEDAKKGRPRDIKRDGPPVPKLGIHRNALP